MNLLNESQRLRRLAFRAPRYYLVFPVILLAILLFYISSWSFIFTLIFSLSILSTLILDLLGPRAFNYKFPPNRVVFLDGVGIYASLIFYFIVVSIRFLQPINALMMSITVIPFLRTLVYITFTGRKIFLSHALGISPSIFFSIFISIFSGKFDIFILPIILSSVVYSLSSHLFVRASLSRFIKEFSTDPIKIINEMINSVTSDLSYNVAVRKFFEDMYTTFAPREVSVVRMESEDSKLFLVFPYVHPGPLGDIGSSNITGKLQDRHPDKNLLVFHTTTTHDDNCAGDAEIDKISAVLNDNGKRFNFCYEPYFGEYLTFLPLGTGGIFFLSPDNPRFDDVKITEGRRIVRKAKSYGLKWAITVDEHNNNMNNPRELEDVSYLMDEVQKAVKSRKSKSSLYVKQVRSESSGNDIGPGGIALVGLKMGEKNVAVVVADGNNMEFELRKKIEAALNDYDKVLVCTTDNHIVNMNGLDVNPVGRSSAHGDIVKVVEELSATIGDYKETKMEYVKREVRVRIAGENQYEKFNRIIRNAANRAKIYSVLAILSSISLSLFIFKFLG